MDDVRVHRDSSQPAQLNALAFAQGSDIHLGPGQDEHLPHEAWHVAQQKQGRVAATTQAKALGVNDDTGLEREADVMGAKAQAIGAAPPAAGKGARGEAAAEAKAAAAEAEAAEEEEAKAAGPSAMTPEVAQAKAAPGGVVQLVKKDGTDVDIETLTLDLIDEHLKRFFRKKAKKEIAGDDAYTYEVDDDKKLKAKQKKLQEADVLKRHTQLVSDLDSAFSTLATATDFTTPPPWAGKTPVPTGSLGSETFKSGSMTADAATVVNAWKSFLGAGPYSNKHPRTGAPETGRVMSADGLRSIRYGDHEKTSKPTLHHYHEETWTYDSGANHIAVINMVQRVPVT